MRNETQLLENASIIKELLQNKIFITETGCWQWKGNKSGRYASFKVGKINYSAHRLSYRIYKGEIPDKMYVCHSCDNPPCINPHHLWIGSAKDNNNDRDRKGHTASNLHLRRPHHFSRGSNHYYAKLNEDDVREIRSSGCSNRELATNYNVSIDNIRCIRRGLSWKHVIVNPNQGDG